MVKIVKCIECKCGNLINLDEILQELKLKTPQTHIDVRDTPKRSKKTKKRSWTDYEITVLKNSWDTPKKVSEIAKELNRSVLSTRTKAKSLGLHRFNENKISVAYSEPRRNKPWLQSEDNYMRKYYPTTNTKEISKDLGRTTTSIGLRAIRLGIKKKVRGK